MSVMRVKGVTVRFDRAVVLRDVYFKLDERERVGLIGPNGAGKTTLLRLLLGELEPTDGVVEIDQGIRIGYFSQFSQLDGSLSVEAILEAVEANAIDAERKLADVSSQLAAPGLDDAALKELLREQAALLDDMQHTDAWGYRNRIDTVLTRLGFAEDDRRRPVDELSGGWRNRAALAKLLLEKPDVLLLDEPTNYLDLDGLAWLESWFSAFRGAAVVVSHDRHFLDQIVERIVEVDAAHLETYEGNYSDYVGTRQLRAKQLERIALEERELLAYEAEAIEERRAKATSKGLRRKLANAKKAATPREVDKITTQLYAGLHVGERLLSVEHLAKARGERELFTDLTFELGRGERLAIVGPNGCGKSTLLQVLEGVEEPDRGRVAWIGATEVASFESIQAELDLNDTVTHTINIAPLAFLAPRKQVHRFLALLGLSELDTNRPIRELSGGQRARVVLARCLLSGAGVVILDEPTNHLDVRTTRAMELALVSFPGAVIVVSHDRFFLDKVATRVLAFTPDGIDLVAGGWSDWHG